MNFLTATGPKLGPRRPRNVPGSTAADQQNRFYDTGKLYYESLASLPCTVACSTKLNSNQTLTVTTVVLSNWDLWLVG